MCSILRFMDEEIVVSRLKTISGNKKAYITTATADCHIQDMSSETRQQLGILNARAWVGYFSVDGIYQPKIGDKIVDDDGMIYKVIDVTRKDYEFSINQYIEAVMVEYDA